MPRFVLLYHDCPPNYERPSHWDLMFESGDALRTWALVELPRDWQVWHDQTAKSHPDCLQLASSNRVHAEQLPNHRLAYLDLEGPLSGDRGQVLRVGAGTFESGAEAPECWQIKLTSDAWRGSAILRQVAAGKFELATGN